MSRDKEVTSRIMKTIKSKGTKPEVLLGKALWADGLRYRKHNKIKGRPDYDIVEVAGSNPVPFTILSQGFSGFGQ